MSDLNQKPLILIADDDEISRMFMVESLEQSGFDTVCVEDGPAAYHAITTRQFRLGLIDVEMPGMNGYEVCRRIRASADLQHLPLVMITGHDDAGSIELAYEAGATDFIAKPLNWTLLPHRLRYILRNAEADSQLRYLAYHDSLSGLPNAQALAGIVAASLARCNEAGIPEAVALLHLDVVGCSRIRSIFGPAEGDEALRAFAMRLKVCATAIEGLSERAEVARIDGDRFIVCLRGASMHARAPRLAGELRAALEEPLTCGEHQFLLPPTIGIALSSDHGADATTLLKAAAAAKHEALRSGSSRAVVYSKGLGDRARDQLELEAALRQAVKFEQLQVVFQPKIRLSDGALSGVEALLRWYHPELGAVTPDRFIPLAEESGLILDIDRWVSQAACRQLMNWREQGLRTRIAINMSARHFVHDSPVNVIRSAASAAGVDPQSIVVEITESGLIQDLNHVRAGMSALRALGCRIAIDDFGTGYSSLAYLKGLPIDELKIDKAFIRNLTLDPVDAAICTTILSLARDIGLVVTAEGVESPQQLAWLRGQGCDEAQGFLIGRPMSASELLARYATPSEAARSA